MSEINVEKESRPKPPVPPTLWQENHGTFLLGFLAFIFVLGAMILMYRQSQFVPPRFPDGSSINVPDVEPEVPNEVEIEDGEHASIIISGAANPQGSMMVALYGSKEGFHDPTQAIMQDSLPIEDGMATWSVRVDELPEKIAVAAFHDENGDGELNRNRVGIPKERYGFSNNARGLSGPPKFSDAVIDRPAVEQEITVYIR